MKQAYNKAVSAYIKAFCKKQDLQFDFWVCDDPGTVAFFGDYCFNFDDIRFDLDTEQKKNLILRWHDWRVDRGLKEEEVINY